MTRAERFDVEVSGHRIAAFRWRPPSGDGSKAPRVMLAHGWESRTARLAAWVDPLLGAGFEVVAFDALAHGETAGRRSSPLTFAAAMSAISERHPRDTEVPFAAAERVARVCPHLTLEEVANRGHRRITQDAAVIHRALDFLAELAPGSAAA